MKLGRLGVLVGSGTLFFAGTYACSSDSSDNTSSGTDAGFDTGVNVADTGTGTPVTDSSTGNETDSSTDAGDAGDSGAIDLTGCVGNPLAADGGVPDASLDASSAVSIGSGNFLYGPVWVDDLGGGVIYSEAFAQQIDYTDGGAPTVLAPTGAVDNNPLQNAASNGYVYTALSDTNGDGGAIMKTQIDGGGDAAATTFFRIPVTDGGVVSANGVAIHAKGILYFTDPQFNNPGIPTTGIYSTPVGGGAITTIATFTADLDDRPVGIAFNKDQSAMFVSHYVPGPGVATGKITKYAVDANGLVSNPTDLNFIPTGRPLGIAIDSAGNIWIAEENADGTQSGFVEVIDPTGVTRWGLIAFGDAHPTGVTFGGADRKTVFITSERNTDPGTLYTIPSRCQGF